MTIAIGFFAALSFGLRDYLLEIRGDDQTCALLINLSNAIMKSAGSETVCATSLDHVGERLQLLQIRTGCKQVILNPDEKLFSFFTGSSRCQRVINEPDVRLVS